MPTSTVGAINITLFVNKNISKQEVLELCTKYEKDQKFDILKNNYEPLVSLDFQGERFTTILDHRFTDVKQNNMLKFVLWYDNEYGYASKVVDIAKQLLFL